MRNYTKYIRDLCLTIQNKWKHHTQQQANQSTVKCGDSWPYIQPNIEDVRQKTNKMQQLDVYYQYFLNVFRTVTFTVFAPYNAAPHNHYQPHPAEPAQHTTCSNTCLVLLKMGIMMPETCWESIDNKHVTVASCWFSLSLHNLLTMQGHRNLKIERFV